jgi:drug/metabolite transporter (DMT)-like permease
MNWVIASILMFFSSVATYLFVRRSNDLKTPQQLNNLAMFLIPVVVYFPLAIKTQTQFLLTVSQYCQLLVQAIFFSYLGNVFSLKGIKYSPNPGYSLIISKSYVVFTAIASIFIFHSPLTLQAVIAIILIVGCSGLIMIDKNKQNSNSKRQWLPYTLGAFFCWGLLALSSKHLLNMGVPVLTRLIFSMSIVVLLIAGEIIVKRVDLSKINKTQVFTLSMIGVFGAGFNYFMQLGFQLAPNVGYINAVNAGSISLLTLMSAFFFKDELSLRRMLGVTGVTAGLIILFL